MTASGFPPSNFSFQRFQEGVALYEKASALKDEKAILAYWEAALPACDILLPDYLQRKESELLAALTNEPGLQALPGIPAKWTVKDMNRYYAHCPIADWELEHQIMERRKALVCLAPVTLSDQLQLYRDQLYQKNSAFLSKRDKNAVLFSSLKIITAAKALLLPPQEKTREKKEAYFCKQLLGLLTVFHQQIQHTRIPELAAEEKKGEEKSEPKKEESEGSGKEISGEDLVSKIDWINQYFAQYFLEIICEDRAASQKEELHELLEALGEQREEVFPWLSVFFQQELLGHDLYSEKETLLIERFFKFHELLETRKRIEGFLEAEIGCQFNWPNFFRLERIKWVAIEKQGELPAKLRAIQAYLQEDLLSDWVTLKIFMYLLEEAKHHGPEPYFSIVLYQAIGFLAKKQLHLPQTFAYLHSIRQTLEHNSEALNEWEKNCPALVVALFQQNPESAKAHALRLGYLPPTAELFYAMRSQQESTKPFVLESKDKIESLDFEDKEEGDKESPEKDEGQKRLNTLIKVSSPENVRLTFTEIFSDPTYIDQHRALLASGDYPEIQKEDYPLLALHHYYAEEKAPELDLLPLWEHVLDSGILVTSPFFTCKKNQDLFKKIESVKERLSTEVQLQSHRKRYKALCLALVVYLGTKAIPPSNFSVSFHRTLPLLGQLKVCYEEETAWAEAWLGELLKKIADPDNTGRIDFANIVQFLNLHLGNPQEQVVLEGENAMAKERDRHNNQIYILHPEVNLTYEYKLLHVIFHFFCADRNFNSPLTLEELHCSRWPFFSFRCVDLLSQLSYPQYVALPPFFPWQGALRIKTLLEENLLLDITQRKEMNKLMLPTARSLGFTDLVDFFDGMLGADFPLTNILQEKLGNFSEKKLAYFIKELYQAHCKLLQLTSHEETRANRTPETSQEEEKEEKRIIPGPGPRKPIEPVSLTPHTLSFATPPVNIVLNQIGQDISDYFTRCKRKYAGLSSWWSYLLGYRPKEIQICETHWTAFRQNLENCTQRLVDLHALELLKGQLETVITKNTYNPGWFSDRPYHRYLMRLHASLTQFESWHRNEKQRRNRSSEEDVSRPLEEKIPEAKNTATTPSPQSAAHIKQQLQAYLRRIESYQSQECPGLIDFSSGFWFFKKSRALNRQANYYLAKKWVERMEKAPPHSPLQLDAPIRDRNTIIYQLHLRMWPGFKERGINSSQLNQALQAAATLGGQAQEQEPRRPSLA